MNETLLTSTFQHCTDVHCGRGDTLCRCQRYLDVIEAESRGGFRKCRVASASIINSLSSFDLLLLLSITFPSILQRIAPWKDAQKVLTNA